MADEARSRLGRGLAALIGDVGGESAVVERARGGSRRVPTAFLRANPRNPRKRFHEEDLEALAGSIKEKGIVQPILVRAVPADRDRYEIVAGERRWRAAQRVGLHEVPIVVVEASDKDALEIALIENVQRADLDPLEEAAGYRQLMEEFGYTQEALAQAIGKSRPHVANTLRLLAAPDAVKALLAEGKLSAGHARAIMQAPAPEQLAQRIVAENLSVRDAEAIAAETKGAEPARRPRAPRARAAKDPDTAALEKTLTEVLGLSVAIRHRGDRGGRIEIAYRTLEQLDEVCRRLQS
jgi:ParB family chromosome partitioning protein